MRQGRFKKTKNLKSTGSKVCAAIFMALASTSSSANIVVLDGWQLMTHTGITTQIGRLNLVDGTSTIEQQVDGTGNAFVGAHFLESGSITSDQFTLENVAGPGDSGPPHFLSDNVTLTFSNVMGTVDALNAGGGFHYVFDSGTFVMSGIFGNFASGSIAGLGGNTSSTAVLGGFTGDSSMLARITSITSVDFDLRDHFGISLKPELVTGDVRFEAVTNNSTTGPSIVGACSFNAGARCISVALASTGDGYLVQEGAAPVPEPASLILVSAGLLAFGAARRGSARM